jgi:hypothetical protein
MHALITILPHWFWHPLGQCAGTHAEVIRCKSYNWWSGIASDLGEVTLIGGLVIGSRKFKKQHECHVESPVNCKRFGRPVPGTGHIACRKHHPHAEEKGAITVEDILRHHEDSMRTETPPKEKP